jgi:ribosomal-protein-alanine N-acetyltransferase
VPICKFNPFPTLTTERLVLRRISPGDAQAIYLQRSSAIVNKYIARVPMADMEEAHAWIARINNNVDQGASVNWAITLKGTGDFIGLICLWNFSEDAAIAETGYELAESYHGKGFMQEALKCMLDYGFSRLDLAAIKAYTHRENASSRKLLEKNGFVWNEGEIDEGFPHNVIYILKNPNLGVFKIYNMENQYQAFTAQIISQVINSWKGQNKNVTHFFERYDSSAYAKEVAPGRNRAIYLLGHLIAVNDGMLPLFGLGERLFPELEAIFVSAPDKSVAELPSFADLKQKWEQLNAKLTDHFDGMKINNWLDRHTAVSEEDFALDPKRNKLNVLLGRTIHQSYHSGQLNLLHA